MSDIKNIPWQDAAEFAKKHEQSMIVILTYDKVTGCEHVITWGESYHESDHAATAGNNIKQLIGWPEKYNEESGKVNELMQQISSLKMAIKETREILWGLHAQIAGSEKLNRPIKILTAALDKKEIKS